MGDAQTFGQWLRQRRKALDITQDDLADCVGCSPAAIRMIEHGQRRPSRQVAELLAGCLRIPEAARAEYVALARQTLSSQSSQGKTEHGKESAQAVTQAVSGNLPAQLTALIGRNEEVETLKKLLLRKDVRLATLTGPPGVGKTSLAIEAATELQDYPQFQDGVFWVALTAVSNPDLVISSIARVLGVQDAGGEPMPDTLKRRLKQSRALLLLDNFEQVVEVAPQIADLLESCANLKALVTSREALNLRVERELGVSPLALPDEKSTTGEALAHNPAVALFVERAQAVDARFSLTEENAPVVAAICARLDGLPLAIELVAARAKILPVKALLARLQDTQGHAHLNLLSGGARDLPGRHKTLRDAIGWSYSLLSSEEQVLFRRLGAFSGGFTLPAAEAVCNADSDHNLDVFEGVSLLLHKNLLKRDTTQGESESAEDEPRFMMLETIREYARESLEESAEADEIRLLHAEYFLAIASSFDPLMVSENERLLGIRLDQDYDNVRAALAWTIENRPVDMAMTFGLSLSRYWELRGYYSEGRDWLERIVSAQSVSDETDPGVRAKRASLLLSVGRLNLYMADYSAARTLLEESLTIASELGSESMIASARGHLGHTAWMQGDYAVAVPLYELCLRMREQEGNKTTIANSNWALGIITGELGDFERAEELLNKSLAMGRELDDTFVTFGSLRDLGTTLCYKGEYGEAILYLEEALALARDAHFRVGVSWCISALGFAKLGLGDYARAEELFRESLDIVRALDKQRTADSLEGMAEVELARATREGSNDHLPRAATLLGAAEVARRILSTKIIPVRVPVRERLVSEVRSRLGDGEYEKAYALGETMSLEEALSYAGRLRHMGDADL